MLGGGITIAGIAADIVVGAGCELHDPACEAVSITGCTPAPADELASGCGCLLNGRLARHRKNASQYSDFAKFIEEPVYSFEHRACSCERKRTRQVRQYENG